jgi:hypothetical protein
MVCGEVQNSLVGSCILELISHGTNSLIAPSKLDFERKHEC